jgi:hypothetical protein
LAGFALRLKHLRADDRAWRDDIMIDPETDHLMIRAEEEAILAIRATHPAAARAHQDMAVHYSTRALTGLVGEKAGEPIEAGLTAPGDPVPA